MPNKLYRAAVRFDAVLRATQRRLGSLLLPKVVLLHHRLSPDRCFYCGVVFGDGETAQSYDHIKPRLHGGESTADNIVPACLRCNHLKGSLKARSFRNRYPELFPHGFWAEATYGCKLTEKIEYPFLLSHWDIHA